MRASEPQLRITRVAHLWDPEHARSDAAASSSAARLVFPAVAWFGRVDAEGLPEAPPSQRGDDDGVAALHPLHPAEIEVALGDRGP
jgi:hypothetical protein